MDFPRGIRPHGKGLQIRLQHRGESYTRTIETRTPHSKRSITSAVRERDEMKRRLELGLPLFIGDKSDNALIKDLAQDYIDTLDVEYSTAQSYVRILNQHWLPNFGHWLATDLRPSHIKKYLNGLTVSQKTKKNIMVPLSSMYNHAMSEDIVDLNPCSAVKIKKGQKTKIERFTPAEREKILNKSNGSALVYFTIMFETGMRPSEILALKWEDYCKESRQIHVCKAIVWRKVKPSTKNHEVRDVFVSDRLAKALASHTTQFKGGYIFENSRGGPFLDTDDFNEAWQEALKKARVRYRIPYTCRHTRASMMLTAGVEPAFAANQLGHTLEMFFRTYAEWINELGDQAQINKLKQLDGKLAK